MLKKLHKLVIKSYLGPLVMTFFIAEFVLIMQFLWLYIGDLVGKGLEWYIIAELLMYASARLAQMALPLAILLASIMTFGNMGEHFELSAMKSAGISLQKIMKPLIVFSIVLSIGSFFFANYVIPYTNLKMGSLLYDISNKRPEMNIKPGVFSNDIPNFSIKIKEKSKTNNMMYGFMIYDHRSHSGNVKVTLADSGFMEITRDQKYMIITLFGGKAYEEMKDEKPVQKNRPENRSFFDKQVSVFRLDDMNMKRTDEDSFRHGYQMKRLRQLSQAEDSLLKVLENKNKYYVKQLASGNYFKYELKFNKKRDSLKYISDSIQKLRLPDSLHVILDIDSLYKTFDGRMKEHVMQKALENAQSTRKYISMTQEDFYDRQKRINKHGIAWHDKFTLSFACLIFFFIGAPLGAIIRKGGFGLPFLVSVTFFILYYIVSIMGRKLVEEGVLVPWQGMWISSLLTLPLGVFFTYKATTDSVLFDVGAYIEFIKRPFKVLDIKYKDPESVFHKDVKYFTRAELLEKIQNLKINANKQSKEIETNEAFTNLYKMHFNNDVSNLEHFIKSYDSLYPILVIENRENASLYENLKKFPRMNIDEYKLGKYQKIANYIFMSIGIIPIGILILINTHLKQKVLKQKLNSIAALLSLLEKHVKNTKEEPHKAINTNNIAAPDRNKIAKITSSKVVNNEPKITDEEILDAITQNKESLNNRLTYLKQQTDNLFDFLKLVFSTDIHVIEELTRNIRVLKSLVSKKFRNNKLINKTVDSLGWIDFDKYRMSKQKIFVNYLLFGFFLPIAAIVFYLSYKKIKDLILDLQNMHAALDNLYNVVETKKYKETVYDINNECSIILSKEPKDVENKQINTLLKKFNKDLSKQIDFLYECDNSIFKFLYMSLTTDFGNNMSNLKNYHNQVKICIQEKYLRNDELLNKYNGFLSINNLELGENRLTILINYFFLTIYPVGFLFFIIKKKKIEKIIEKLKKNYQTIE